MTRKLRHIVAGIAVGCVAAVIAMGALGSGLLHSLENITFDLRARTLARPGKASDDVRVILLDQRSLDWAQESFELGWPWPRQAYVPIVDFCREAGAASLAFDVVFTEPSVYGVEDDRALAAAFTRMGRVILAADFARHDGSAAKWPDNVPPPRSTVGDTHAPRTANVATFPIPDITSGIAAVGNVNVSPDADTIYRRFPLFLNFNNKLVPSLPLAAALTAKQVSITEDEDSIAINGTPLPLTQEGDVILNYRGKGAYKAYSAAAVMESGMRMAEGGTPVIDPAEFKDKHILFGFSATGLFDLRPTPMGGVSPGVVVNATALDNMLSGDFMRPGSLAINGISTLFFAVMAGLSVTVFRQLWVTVAASAMTLALPVAWSMLAYMQGTWVGMAVQLTSTTIALFLAGAFKYATEGRQKHFIKSAFKQYLSPKVIEQLLQHPEKLSLGGERRELTIFFSDLEGFTSISEKLTPEELTGVLNDYLTAMTDIIQEAGGTVDKYEGDAIIAFWNAPVDQPDHAERGVRAALKCQEKLAEMRPSLLKRTGSEFRMRIGLNTGHAVVGNLGSHERFDYTMLGDAVNLAARLESVNKQFGTYTMISKATLDRLEGDIPVRELSRLRVVGKTEPVTVFEPMSPHQYEQRKETLSTFAQGLEAYYSGDFDEAYQRFSAVAGMDPTAERYIPRCAKLLSAPPSDWDGVWTLSSK